MRKLLLVSWLIFSGLCLAQPPNVILIMTDDQGYGDLSCHGNPILKTPALDQLHAESIRFTDFHVMPFCTPTRAALMTGRNATRTGAYRTSSGRTMLHVDEVTMAEVFKAGGYATGIFGKWHLGDNYPHRPQDRGFEETLWHRCGGVGQASDYWGNDYFDDTYEHNGKFEKFEGYCTDVWFEGALKFIKANGNEKKPFFAYIPSNAPHGPYLVDKKYAAPYRDKATWRSGANFYGMIANIDENVARLRAKLKEWDLDDNTILIFMTDNGTSAGAGFTNRLQGLANLGFNAGMRAGKSSIFDGGHRVPFFIHWPKGQLTGGKDIEALSAGWDVLPTLIDLCGLEAPEDLRFDGVSLVPLLKGTVVPERTLVMQYQGGAHFRYSPEPWTDSVVMTKRWRLLNGKVLYDMGKDPGQSHDVAVNHPEVVKQLRAAYEPWWKEVSPRIVPVAIHLGNEAENPMTLSSQDWYMPVGNPPWHPNAVKKRPRVSGPWIVHLDRAGTYEITLRQLPKEAPGPVHADKARLKIGGVDEEKAVPPGANGVVFTVKLEAGPTELETFLTTAGGKTGGAYFVDVAYPGNR